MDTLVDADMACKPVIMTPGGAHSSSWSSSLKEWKREKLEVRRARLLACASVPESSDR